MSGNPFRRAQPDHQLASSPPPKPKGKKKRVTIQTPPHSPEETRARPIHEPPNGRSAAAIDAQSYFNADDLLSASSSSSDSGPTFRTALPASTSSMRAPPFTSFSSSSVSKAPYNPFARTLATKEAGFGRLGDEPGERTNGEETSAARPAFDVDTFKNILMGTAPSPSTTTTTKSFPGNEQLSAVAGAPSPNPFGNIVAPHPESPRVSLDHDAPDLEDNDHAQEENSSLMGPIDARLQEVAPDAPPKPATTRSAPQTVSFADFEDPFFAQGAFSPSIGDINKPLPVPPSESETTLILDPTLSARNPLLTSDHVQAKKAPPPPPAARRQAQPNTAAHRSRNASNASVAETPDSEPEARPATRPPVPPPQRASGSHLIPSPQASPAQLSQSISSASAATEPKFTPPPPPRRNSSKSGPSLVRTPSTASRSSMTDSLANPNNSSSTNLAPVPPPPRRAPAASRRTANDSHPPISSERRTSASSYRRASTQSFNSDHSGSIVSLQRVDEPDEYESRTPPGATNPPDRDILADMTAFQAEVEALRIAQGG